MVLLSLKLAYGQEVGTSMNFTKLFQQKYQDNASNALLNEEFHTENETRVQTVYVKYESPTTILIRGDLITITAQDFNSDLWEAMDLLKNQYGFKLQQVMTSGVRSEGNPIVVYILMTK